MPASIIIMFGNVTSGSSIIKEYNYYFLKKLPYSISTAVVLVWCSKPVKEWFLNSQ